MVAIAQTDVASKFHASEEVKDSSLRFCGVSSEQGGGEKLNLPLFWVQLRVLADITLSMGTRSCNVEPEEEKLKDEFEKRFQESLGPLAK